MRLYDRYIIIMAPSVASDVDGYYTTTYNLFCTTWGKKDLAGSSEGEKIGRITGKDTYIYYVRYYPGINRSMRLIDGDEVYEITAVNETQRKTELKIEVTRYT